MPMIDHRIKCHPESFAGIKSGEKPFTVRLNDRGYKEGDLLLIEEWFPIEKGYSGAAILARASWIHAGLGMKPEYVVIGLCGMAWAGDRIVEAASVPSGEEQHE